MLFVLLCVFAYIGQAGDSNIISTIPEYAHGNRVTFRKLYFVVVPFFVLYAEDQDME